MYHALISQYLKQLICSNSISVTVLVGGISKYKLESAFPIQNGCVRLLFVNALNFDHAEYYQTCARAKTYQQHKTKKNFLLEHTKLYI